MSCQKWDLYQECSVTELHITKGADYIVMLLNKFMPDSVESS